MIPRTYRKLPLSLHSVQMTKTYKTSLASLILGILSLLSVLAGGSAGAVTFTYNAVSFPNTLCSTSLNIDASGIVSCAGTGTTSQKFAVTDGTPCTTGLVIKAPGNTLDPSAVSCARTLPDNCALAVSPVKNAYAPGETVTLTVSNCSPAATSYDWKESTGPGLASAQTNTTTNTLSASAKEGYYTYSVRASNAAGAGSSASAIVKVAVPGQSGPYAYLPVSTGTTTPGVVKVIDTSTNAIVGSPIVVGVNPLGVAVAPDGRKVYVTNSGSHSVSVIDAAKNTVTATVDVGDYPFGVAVKPDGSKVYVANSVGNSVSVIDTATNKVVTVSVGSKPQGVAVKPDGTRVYVANSGSKGVSVIDTVSNSVVGTVPTDSGPYGVAVNPAGTRVYVTNSASSTVSVFDAASNAFITSILVGTTPQGIAINPAGTLAYVTNNGSRTVSVIDLDASHAATYNTVIATRDSVGLPYGVAFHPAGNAAYVTSYDDRPLVGGGSVTTLEATSGSAVGLPVPLDGRSYALGQFIGPAAPLCTLTASPAAISAGGSATLTASCSPTPTSYVWTGGTCAGTSAASCTVTPSATTTYTVAGSNATGNSAPGSATLIVGPATALYTGLWYNPTESGWGMSITQHGSTIFAVPYTYDAAGKPTWYVMDNCPMLAAGSCTGNLYQVSGGSSPAVPWSGAGKVVSPAGSGTLSFTDASHGTFSFNLTNGGQGSKAIERQLFSSASAQFALEYTDLWWNPSESGWGVALTHQSGTIFVTWYGYDANGKAIWYVASNCVVAGSGCSGDLYQVTGGTPLTVPWTGVNKSVAKVGAVSFSFSDASNGLMSYTFDNDGVPRNRSITRQSF